MFVRAPELSEPSRPRLRMEISIMVETSSPLRVVLVEDNKNDRLLFREAFEKSDVSCDIAECTRAEEALELLGADTSSFDVVAVAHNLPGISGMDLCRKVLDNKTPLPLVLLTEMGSERLAAEALRAGVQDYIIKDPERGYLDLLPMSLTQVARRHEDYRSHKQIRQALRNIEKATGALFDAIPDTALLVDTEGNILLMNKAGADRLGKNLDEIIGRNVREFFHEDVYELRQSKAKEVIRTGKMISYEDERDEMCFETWICPIFDAQGEVERLTIFAHDVTDRKQTEKELRDSKYLLEKTFNSLDRAVLVLDNRKPPRIIDCNPATIEIFGYPKNRMIGQTSEILHVDRESLLEFQKKLYPTIETKGYLSSFEFSMKRSDGEIFPTEHSIRPLTNDTGERIGWVSIVSDITERKKAEDALIQSEEKFRLAMEATNDALWDWNLVTNEVYRNPRHATMLGYQPHELTASQDEWEKRIHPDDRQSVFKTLEEHLAGKKESFEIEYRLRTKSGDYIWILGRGKVVAHANDGKPIRMVGTNIDITDRKKLRDRDEIILKTCIDGFWVIDAKGRILEVNDAYCRMSGYSRDELLTMSVQDLEAAETPHETLQHIRGVMEIGYHRFQSRQKRKDGTIMDLDISANYLGLDGGRVFTFFRDITAIKQAEHALQESELRYRTLFEILPLGIGLSTFDGRIIDTNSTFQQMLGYSIEEMRRIKVLDTYHNPAERAILIEQLQKIGFVRDFEVQLKRKDGTTLLASLNVTTTKMYGETVLVTAVRDITEQRRMERALVESEEKYRTLVECARDPIFTVDERGVFLFTNKVGAETLGYQPEGLAGKTLWDIFPKEIADRQAANVRKVIENGQGINSISLTEIQNKPRWYSATIEPLRDNHGGTTAAMVIARDIDDMKRAEEQIKKLSSALESSINGIIIGNIEGNLTYVNNSFLKMWDYEDQSEVLGRNATEFWEVNDKAAEIKDALLNGEGWIGELTAVRKDGSKFDVQVCQTLIRDEDGRIVSLMGSFVDISESKRSEEELLKYRGQMARAEQLASLGTLSATVAHQITQPLTVIRLSMDNALDELQATSSSETVIKRLKDSVTQVSNITSIVDRFRNFARKSSGRTVAEVDLKAVALRVARLLSESARSAGIALRLGNMSGLPCPWMNETDLEQLFFALIENAIQAANGKKARQLVISGSVKDEHIELRFSDNCGGISPENLDKIFEPFFTTKPRGQGTGLGLCIAKDVASRTGGHVRVENKFGKGTTFIISLPIDQGKIS